MLLQLIRLRAPLLAVLQLCVLIPFVGCSLPSDAKLERRFFEHRETFEDLIRMAREDDRAISITVEYVVIPSRIIAHMERATDADWKECLRFGISRQRYKRYLDLFKSLDLQGIGIDRTTVFLAANPVINDFFTKGFAYSTGPLQPCLPDLDRFQPSDKQKRDYAPVYKVLTGHWYLFMRPL